MNTNTESKKKIKPYSRDQIAELHQKYVGNVTEYPALLRVLSGQLGLSVLSLIGFQVGFIPITPYDTGPAWAFPERNENGDIIGITIRMMDGKKLEVAGSKRGLTFRPRYETDSYEHKKWQRVSTERPCILCKKSDGCMYPEGEYDSPAAVVCVHIAAGSRGPLSPNAPGYLHVLDHVRNQCRISGGILGYSKLPILITEGATDTIAAAEMGFTAIGRANYAVGNEDALISLVKNRDVVIIGDRDKESKAGEKGMESVHVLLRDVCKSCVKLLPPGDIKDLRQWFNQGLTQDRLLDFIRAMGDTKLNDNTFENNLATTIGNELLKSKWTNSGKLTLGKYRGRYIEYIDGRYQDIKDNEESVRCDVLNFLAGKKYVNYGDNQIKRFNQSIQLARCVVTAINNSILIRGDTPCFRNDKSGNPNPKRLIPFKNGVLDVDAYRNGNIVLHDPNPDLVHFNCIPYSFDEAAESKLWEDYTNDVFNGDKESIQLLSEWFGNNCIADADYQEMMIFVGQTASGKSTTLHVLKAMLGEDNCTSTNYQTLKGPFGLQPLVGKLAAIMGDVRNPSKKETGELLTLFLQIVGMDDMPVNQKYKEIQTIQLPCRFTMACNSLPRFTDNTLALHRRVNILRFPNSYLNKEDKGLTRRLVEEAKSGKLMNFALRGLKSLYQNQKLIVPATSQQDLKTLKEITSPILSFFDECLQKVDDPITAERTSDLYGVWRWWCENEGQDPGDKRQFIKEILDADPQSRSIRRTIDGKPQVKVVTRIKINEAIKNSFINREAI